MAALLIPAVGAARQAARHASSHNNLKLIGLALHNYHDVYNSLPPAYTTDVNGKPLLSWRVAILPFLEGQSTFEKFDLDQPWDSAANQAIAKPMPSVYQSPTYGAEGSDQTNYLAVRSTQSAFPGDKAVQFQDIVDGTSNTLVVVEFPNKSTSWTKPDDSDPADVYAAFNNATSDVSVLFADGSVKRLSSTSSRSDLDAFITRDGGEQVIVP